MKIFNQSQGFSLIELILFIVIIGIAAVTLLLTLQTVLQNAPTANSQTQAIALAQERMDFILGQRQLQGFSSFTDPCSNPSPPSICTPLSGYTVSSSIANSSVGGDTNFKIITVTATGPNNAKAVLATQVGS